ncbi:MAG: NADH-quinone oxidoreductase subunit NuoI [Thiovulaceae bacterium]|nr:NADH-quinone oxidoreductase subunit NuoI [Sulfurimonadaceae bacterium]
MNIEEFENRNVGTQNYVPVEIPEYPTKNLSIFKQVVLRAIKGELFKGLMITLKELIRFDIHTVQYPMEKLPIGPRYRAVHKLLRLWESGYERCIGCGLCEKICISDCIRMDTKIDEKSRKEVTEYSINLGRCIFCGYCAEVCPELAIVHGPRYETAGEQRAHFVLKDDMLTPMDVLVANGQEEYPGFGALIPGTDSDVVKTPLAY